MASMAFDFGTQSGGASPSDDLMKGFETNFGLPGGGGGQNQFMRFPTMGGPSGGGKSPFFSSSDGFGPMPMSQPGIVPPSSSAPSYPWFNEPVGLKTVSPGSGGVGQTDKLPGGQQTVPTVDPLFTQDFSRFLRSQLGKGATPFDLSAILPSTRQATAPGTLTAPENPLMQLLQQFYSGKGGGPDSFILPMWQSQLAAMQQPIQQNLAQLREQFGSQGALGSSEMAQAMQNYLSQTSLQEQSLLGQETLQALPGMESEAAQIQQLDQSSIDRLVQEFIRTQPENSPLLNMEAQYATTYPPSYGKHGFGPAFSNAFGSALGTSLGTFGVSAGGGSNPSISTGG